MLKIPCHEDIPLGITDCRQSVAQDTLESNRLGPAEVNRNETTVRDNSALLREALQRASGVEDPHTVNEAQRSAGLSALGALLW